MAYLPNFDDDPEEVITFHLFPDAEAMMAHMRGVSKPAQRAAEVLDKEYWWVTGAQPRGGRIDETGQRAGCQV